MSDPTQNPSQLHGHATYVAGAAKEALGFESGKDDKEYAVREMRAAREVAGEWACVCFLGWGCGTWGRQCMQGFEDWQRVKLTTEENEKSVKEENDNADFMNRWRASEERDCRENGREARGCDGV